MNALTRDDTEHGTAYVLFAEALAAVAAERERCAMQRPGGTQRKDNMSIHVCKGEHNGRTEYHLRYPGMTQEEAQALADRINGGELVGAEHPLRKDAELYRWLRDNTHPDNLRKLFSGCPLDGA